jgi:hypothetical protein
MRRSMHRASRNRTTLSAGLALTALLLAACSPTTPSPTPDPTPSPSPGPELGFRLRATTIQALPPKDTFTWVPSMLITDDLVAIQQGAIPLIFPGPLVNPLIGIQLNEEAWAKIATEAEDAGLLSGETDFGGEGAAPGAASARLELVIDGTHYDLRGNPDRVAFCGDGLCPAEPGTPEAFATFVSLLNDLRTWIGAGVGAQADWKPAGYAVLVGPPAPDDQGLAVAPFPWPFESPAATFGEPVAGEANLRCGTVTGNEAATFEVALRTANQLTTWRDPAAANDFGFIVRPLLAGDGDPCAPLVGA